MATFDNLSWHPNKDDIQFKEIIEIFNKFRSSLNENANDLPLNDLDNHSKLYEVNIYCEYQPLHHVESYWNVDIRKKNDWWLTNNQILSLKNYGFKLQCIKY